MKSFLMAALGAAMAVVSVGCGAVVVESVPCEDNSCLTPAPECDHWADCVWMQDDCGTDVACEAGRCVARATLDDGMQCKPDDIGSYGECLGGTCFPKEWVCSEQCGKRPMLCHVYSCEQNDEICVDDWAENGTSCLDATGHCDDGICVIWPKG
jgi:hypothetical protein